MHTRVTTHSTQTALCPFIDVLTLNLAFSFFFFCTQDERSLVRDGETHGERTGLGVIKSDR